MLWAPFLHIYQPPTQYRRILKKIAVECYAPLVETFERNPRAKITLSIPASLTEQLVESGYSDLISRLGRLAERGQVEFTGSAAYHPLLTRLPEDEVERQIKLNEEINRRYFGIFKPRGFFPPEMAYSMKVGEIIAKLGYDWILLEEITYPDRAPPRRDIIYQQVASKLRLFFRERDLSLAIAFGGVKTISEFKRKIEKKGYSELGDLPAGRQGKQGSARSAGSYSDREVANKVLEPTAKGSYVLTAMDGETFGHHRPGAFTFLNDLYREFESATISELLNLFPVQEETAPLECTWAASWEECRRGIAYPRWDNPQSLLHTKQWELYQLAIEVVRGSAGETPPRNTSPRKHLRGVPQVRPHLGGGGIGEVGESPAEESAEQHQWLKARRTLDKALHSDQFWWASHAPFWHSGMVKRGAEMLLKAVNTTPGVSKDERKRAKKLYDEIVTKGVKLYGKKPIIG